MNKLADNRAGAAEADGRPIALVAGASRGLGLLIARELHHRGYCPVITARSATELDQAARQLARDGIRVLTEVMDVARPAQVQDVVARVEEQTGPIDVLLCVAGVIQVGPLAALERSDFVEAVDVMLWGPINTALAVIPHMRRRGRGRIGIVASVGGLISAPHLLPYSTAKFAAVGFARGLRSELVGTGISVTTVTPGLMRTGSHLRAMFRGDVEREYAWFATAASLPVLSMDAGRAARRIVTAVLRGRPVLLLTPLARLAPRVDALTPRLGAAVLSLTTRLLPAWSPESSSVRLEGRQVEARLPRPRRARLRRLTTWGRRAAERTNE
ncbi:MAG: SDR family oxidoreductase [Microlunatus sp.]|nr:SDR family oxidoreductase [Microlunatus sp.]